MSTYEELISDFCVCDSDIFNKIINKPSEHTEELIKFVIDFGIHPAQEKLFVLLKYCITNSSITFFKYLLDKLVVNNTSLENAMVLCINLNKLEFYECMYEIYKTKKFTMLNSYNFRVLLWQLIRKGKDWFPMAKRLEKDILYEISGYFSVVDAYETTNGFCIPLPSMVKPEILNLLITHNPNFREYMTK